MSEDYNAPILAATEAPETDEVDAQAGRFLWSGRTAAEWQAVAPRDIAALIRATVAHAGGTTDCLDPTFLVRYDLVEAAGCLSDDGRAHLAQAGAGATDDALSHDRYGDPGVPASRLVERVLPRILPAVTQAFAGAEGRRLIGFLGALKQARAEQLARDRVATASAASTRRQQSTTAMAGSASALSMPRDQALVAEALAQLRLPPAQGDAVRRDYRRLQDGVGPLFEEIADQTRRLAPRRRSINQEREDRVGFALYRSVEILVTFYWEPVTLDPVGTITHFLHQVTRAAYHDHSMELNDTRGIEVHGERDDLFGPGSATVEAQAAENEVYELLAQVCTGDPTLYAVAWGHIIDRVSLAQLGTELGLSTAETKAAWSTIRMRLHAALMGNYAVAQAAEAAADADGGNVAATGVSGVTPAAESVQEPDSSPRHTRGQPSALWSELVTRNEHFRERLRQLGELCLLECQRVILTAALDVATGERNSTIQAVAATLGGRFSEALIRRQIQLAADLLERRGSRGRSDGGWLTKEGEWHQRRQTLAQLRANPNFWDGLSPQLQELIEAYYLQPPTMPTHAAVGARLSRPVHSSIVSRRISRLEKIVAMHTPGVTY